MDNVSPIMPVSKLRNPERVAWGVILIAFAVFCLICVLSLVAIHDFFFQSRVPMVVRVHAARGTAGLTPLDLREVPVRDSTDFPVGSVARPNPQSQTLIVFSDPYEPSRILALVTLDESASAVTLRTAERPRYDWGTARYEISLENVEGEVDVFVTEGFKDNLVVYIKTKQGGEARIIGSGEHNLRIFNDYLLVVNVRGEVVLIDLSLSLDKQAKSVPSGFQGIIRSGASEITVARSGYVNLLENPFFENTAGELPLAWRCWNEPGTTPSGVIRTGFENGRKSLFMVRSGAIDPNNPHGATFCEQGATEEETPNWKSVRDYDYLALKTTFFVNFQSLNRCGEQGSECPLIVRLYYIDVNGNERELLYGFYVVNDPQRDDPTICETCRQEHILIHEKNWYTYSTGNILTTLPPDQLPDYITRVRFYASGHLYDVRISELSLEAGVMQDITPFNTVPSEEITP